MNSMAVLVYFFIYWKVGKYQVASSLLLETLLHKASFDDNINFKRCW